VGPRGLQDLLSDGEDLRRRDLFQATIVRAMASEAGDTIHLPLQDAMTPSIGSSPHRIGRAEEGDGGEADGRGDMHGPTITGDHQFHLLEEGTQFLQVDPSCCHQGPGMHG
jgi:hypothetical protein